jgi:uncharacterized protein YuzE
MKMTFDPEADALYIQIAEGKIEESEAMEPDVIYDYDADDRILGIELLRVTHHLPGLIAQKLPFQDPSQQLEFVAFLKNLEQSLARK